MTTQVMVPGILVALKTSVHGGVDYQRTDLEQDDEGKVAKWETTRYMDDPAEHKAATQVSSKAAGLVSKLCVRTGFGLLCRVDREAELDAAVIEMREMVEKWNSEAQHSFVQVTTIKGRIADNDAEAIRAILDEARGLIDEMNRGLSEEDVEKIRAAASRAKVLGEMMTPATAQVVNDSVRAAREAAKAIVKKSNGFAAVVMDPLIKAEAEAFADYRFELLELRDETIEALPAVNLQRGAELEL